MTKLFKPYIDSLQPYVPGKPIDEVKRELGLSDVIKAASNENALGVSKRVKDAIIKNLDTINRYPDGGVWRLKQRLATYLDVDADEIVIGNGSNEIIEFISKGFIDHGDEVLSSQYAFLVYPLLTQVCNGVYREIPATKDLRFDLDTIRTAISEKTKVIFLANPNNPTGTYFTKSEFESFLKSIPPQIIVCLDEAYIDFVDATDCPNGLDYFRKENVIVLRTFSKSCGLAGLRIGYGIARKEIVSYFNKIRQPFNVNSLAQVAARAALDDEGYRENTIALVREGKKFLYDAFGELGLEYVKSQTNFILVKVNEDSREYFERALKEGIVLRDMKAYKLDQYVRITIGTEEENKKVIQVLRKLLDKKP